MEQPLVVRSPHLPLSDSQERLIRRLAEKLERYYPRLIGCEVSVEPPPRSHRSGGPWKVRIEMSVPGHHLHVSDSHDETLEGALRAAFAAASRRIEDISQLKRHEVKRHEPSPREIRT